MASTASKIANAFFNAMIAPDQAPMERSEREALRTGLDMIVFGVDQLERIANALERSATAAEGTRPAHDSLDAL